MTAQPLRGRAPRAGRSGAGTCAPARPHRFPHFDTAPRGTPNPAWGCPAPGSSRAPGRAAGAGTPAAPAVRGTC
eukprot:15471934-Alexandrium_andersonii.AAC.1